MSAINAVSKKRGRPRKYASAEEKNQSDISRKRVRRQEESARHREVQFNHAFAPIQHTAATHAAIGDPGVEDTVVHAPGQFHSAEDNLSWEDELGRLLPPPSPQSAPHSPQFDRHGPEEPFIFNPMLRTTTSPAIPEQSPQDDYFNMPELDIDWNTPDENMPAENIADINTVEDQETMFCTPDTAISTETAELALRLTDQLARHQGCCVECHRDQGNVDEHENHAGLQEYLGSINSAITFPDVLGSQVIATRESDLIGQISAAAKREVYCGFNGDGPDSTPVNICLSKGDQPTITAGVKFDIDSITGFPSSLAVAKQGVRWNPTQLPVSDLQSNLHLDPQRVFFTDGEGRLRSIHKPIHHIPHYTFGRLIGLEDVSLYLLFPRLYREEQQSCRLRDCDFKLWTDEILLPAIYRHYSSSHVQHYPSSFDHSRYNATARGVEGRSQRIDATPREQQLMQFLPPDSLHSIWESILQAVQGPGFQHFRDVTIFLQAKNLKTLTKDSTWELMMTRFQKHWNSVVVFQYITPNFFYDIGKETCPQQPSYVVGRASETGEVNNLPRAQAETLLWKRCCQDSFIKWVQSEPRNEDTHQEAFYPFSLLHSTGSLTVETGRRSRRRRAGLLYSQFYPSIKEVFAAGNQYPFTNTAIESLALDPKLRRTWELVGGGLSHNPVALVKAYLYTKLRCHFATEGSMEKSFGIREEHRLSYNLFHALDAQFRVRLLHSSPIPGSLPGNQPYYSFPTSVVLHWLRWSINKFCVGFEMVYSHHDRNFVTWEHTRIMLMFLRCLQFSYSGGLIQKVGGCWQDTRYSPDATQPDGLRRVEGLGFRRTMERYGYAWFLDKVDWETMTFRQPHAQYMMFNNPSMQAAYHARYSQIRDVRIDFIRVDKARQWMLEFSSVPACQSLLENYLKQLCLCAFRKDVFTHIRPLIHSDHVEAALAGQIPLCLRSVERILIERHQPLHLAGGKRIAVKSLDVLFPWLWEWNDGKFERQGWGEKPYRMLYQQSFDVISLVRGKSQAREWKKNLKLDFIKSHWLLPYPQKRSFMRKDKSSGKVAWWPSYHGGLRRYYEGLSKYEMPRQPFPSTHIKHYPTSGWRLAGNDALYESMPYEVLPEQDILLLSEEEIYRQLLQLQESFISQPNQRVATVQAPIQIYDIQSYNFIRDSSYDMNREAESYRNTNECTMRLREELENYEILQHHQRNLRRRKRNVQHDVISGSDSEQEEYSDLGRQDTSDEESLNNKRKVQTGTIRRLEAQWLKLIDRDRKRAGEQHQNLHEWAIKQFQPRLRRVR